MKNVSYAEAVKRGWLSASDVPVAASRLTKRDAEGTEQCALIQQFRVTYPDLGMLLIHIPNGGSRKNAFEGWRLKQQGVRAGVSDLHLPIARGGYFGLWIEFKAAPPNNAVVSDSQKDWLEQVANQGFRAEICLGVDAAMTVLVQYLSLPPTKILT